MTSANCFFLNFAVLFSMGFAIFLQILAVPDNPGYFLWLNNSSQLECLLIYFKMHPAQENLKFVREVICTAFPWTSMLKRTTLKDLETGLWAPQGIFLPKKNGGKREWPQIPLKEHSLLLHTAQLRVRAWNPCQKVHKQAKVNRSPNYTGWKEAPEKGTLCMIPAV